MREQADRVTRFDTTHFDDSGEVEATREHRELGEQLAARGVEQVVAPRNSVRERAVPDIVQFLDVDDRADPVAELGRELSRREREGPRGCEFECQRDAVEMTADLDCNADVIGPGRCAVDVGRTVEEQLDRIAVDPVIHVDVAGRDRHRWNRIPPLTGEPEALAGCGHDGQGGDLLEQLKDQVRCGDQQVLTVVEHDQRLGVTGEMLHDPLRCAVGRAGQPEPPARGAW